MSGWRILIPVKQLKLAKTRTGLNADERKSLSLAMLRDVLAAVKQTREVAEVIICTSDPQVRDACPEDTSWLTSGRGGLNSDIAETLAAVSMDAPGRPSAVVVADLPCLRPDDLGTVLSLAVRQPPDLVSSCDGGTTILAAWQPHRLKTQFGEGSAREHTRCYRDVSSHIGIGNRLDIDTLEALLRGHLVGLGPRTQNCLMSLGGPHRLMDRREHQRLAGGPKSHE